MQAMSPVRQRTVTAVFVIALAVVVAGTSTVSGADYALSPQQSLVAPGALCTLSVVVNTPGDSLACVECRISYDPSLVTVVDAREGSLFTTAGVGGLYFNGAVAPDTQYVEGCLLGYRTYNLSPGELARFIFQADAPGVCPVRIERLNVWDIDRELFTPAADPYAWITIGTPSSAQPTIPAALRFEAYPNPFNPTTTLVLSGVTVGEAVDVVVYAPDGRRVRTLARGTAGSEVVRLGWDGCDDRGRRAHSGVYFAAATAGGHTITRKLVLLQ